MAARWWAEKKSLRLRRYAKDGSRGNVLQIIQVKEASWSSAVQVRQLEKAGSIVGENGDALRTSIVCNDLCHKSLQTIDVRKVSPFSIFPHFSQRRA